MSLPHILLGMLSTPASGYDLRNRFDASLRHFWRAELSQIYPALKRLEEQRLLSSKTEASDQGPDRRVYKRTAKGTRAFRDWLAAGPEAGTERLAHLAQVFFLGQTGDHPGALSFFEQLRSYFANWLEELRQAEANWRDADARYPDALTDEGFYMHMTLRNGLVKLAAQVAWCDECIGRIRSRINAAD